MPVHMWVDAAGVVTLVALMIVPAQVAERRRERRLQRGLAMLRHPSMRQPQAARGRTTRDREAAA